MEPSLATQIKDLWPYMLGPSSQSYAMQQKIDGHRVILVIDNNKVTAIGRNGEERKFPKHIERVFEKLSGKWTFDGELVGTHYWIFDILDTPRGSVQNLPWIDRQEFLRAIFAKGEIPYCSLVPYVTSMIKKNEFFNMLRGHHAEGVVFKDITKIYFPGRSEAFLKYKFTNTVDCVVIDKGVEGKDNLVLGAYDNGNLVEVGKVSALTGDGEFVKVGDVVEVTCLYVTNSNKLYQPVSPKIRLDKGPTECTIKQLEALHTNKTVLTLKEKK